MGIDSSAINRYGGDYSNSGINGGGSNLLLQLEDRVSQALKNDKNQDAVDPQLIKNMIAQISPTPLAGMSQNFII